MAKMKSDLALSLQNLPEEAWVFIAKAIGAICGSAISIAYFLPSDRREAFLRFAVGITIGMIFGTAAGIKLADYLKIMERMTAVEIALSGGALASLSAWWGLGILSRLATRIGATK